jgi:hypothetical protein
MIFRHAHGDERLQCRGPRVEVGLCASGAALCAANSSSEGCDGSDTTSTIPVRGREINSARSPERLTSSP